MTTLAWECANVSSGSIVKVALLRACLRKYCPQVMRQPRICCVSWKKRFTRKSVLQTQAQRRNYEYIVISKRIVVLLLREGRQRRGRLECIHSIFPATCRTLLHDLIREDGSESNYPIYPASPSYLIYWACGFQWSY